MSKASFPSLPIPGLEIGDILWGFHNGLRYPVCRYVVICITHTGQSFCVEACRHEGGMATEEVIDGDYFRTLKEAAESKALRELEYHRRYLEPISKILAAIQEDAQWEELIDAWHEQLERDDPNY